MTINRIIPVLVFLALQACPCSAGQILVAVLPGNVTRSAEAASWLGTGLSFDIEKRLERWEAVATYDRIDVRRAVKLAAEQTEASAVASVFTKLHPQAVITFSGSQKQGQIDLQACVWTDPEGSADTASASGKLEDLFILNNTLVDKIVQLIRQKFNSISVPKRPDRLHLLPAASVSAYESMIRGMTASQSGNQTEARSHLVKALELDPQCWWAHYFMGSVEFHHGHFTQAVERCRSAIGIDPDLYPAVYANLCYCASGAGDEKLAQWAKTEFEKRTGKPLPNRGLPVTTIRVKEQK